MGQVKQYNKDPKDVKVGDKLLLRTYGNTIIGSVVKIDEKGRPCWYEDDDRTVLFHDLILPPFYTIIED